MRLSRVGPYLLVVGLVAPLGVVMGHIIWPARQPPQPKINIENVVPISAAVPGQNLMVRVYSPTGSPRPDCIALTSRDFKAWTSDGHYRWTRAHLLANVTIVPMDPPVPKDLQDLPQAPWFDVSLPMPAWLPDWPGMSFQTGALPVSCPGPNTPNRDRVENRITEFSAPVEIVKPNGGTK